MEDLNTELCNAIDTDKKAEVMKEIDNVHKELQILREPRIRAAMQRARVQNYEEGEKPSKYFCNLEKKIAAKKSNIMFGYKWKHGY